MTLAVPQSSRPLFDPLTADGRGTYRESRIVACPRASVQALSTTEFNVVTGVVGKILWPRLLIVKKAAGAYTITGITMMTLGWGTVADNIPCWPWDAPGASLLIDSGVSSYSSGQLFHNGFSAGLPFGLLSLAGVVGKKLAIRTLVASPAGAGGDLKIKCYYDELPYSMFDL